MNLKCLAAVAAIVVSACAFGANPPGFTDDYDAALKRAATEKKVVFAVFSGSDWCYYCKLLESQFLVKKEFTAAVKKDIVCLFVDSPRDKSRLSEKARTQNPKLVKKYGIDRYPSVMFIDANGNKIADAEVPKTADPGAWGKSLVAAAKGYAAKAAAAAKPAAPKPEAAKPAAANPAAVK